MSANHDLFAKAYRFEDAKKLQKMGLYPYFRPITASTGNNVVTHGKRNQTGIRGQQLAPPNPHLHLILVHRRDRHERTKESKDQIGGQLGQ